MNQDIEAVIALVLGILFCLIIVTASNSTDDSTIIDQWIDESAERLSMVSN
jgi:hypothetical protein